MAYTTIDDPTIYFNTKLYTGNGSTSHSITGVGFQPDFVWIKRRDAAAGHKLNDAVRGVNKQLVSNNNNAEDSNTDILTAFGTNGFTLGNNSDVNNGSGTFVSWNWKAGGSASSNTDGNITSTVSANTTAGFSIVKFTAPSGTANKTIGHGLNAVPKVVIVKHLSTTGNWQMYFEGIGTANQQLLSLNSTNAVANYSNLWGAGMTSSVIGIGINTAVTVGEDCIAYAFAEKKGYSKFGSYTGNGNADGTFVYTGFKPAFVMLKVSSTTNDWIILDNKRDTFNVATKKLLPNESNAESSDSGVSTDFLSNGFKFRTAGNNVNVSGGSYIFMSFAESPFVNSNGIPACAR